jgi:hypothetical protein
MSTLGYYIHSGGHGTLQIDSPVFLEFLKKNLNGGK